MSPTADIRMRAGVGLDDGALDNGVDTFFLLSVELFGGENVTFDGDVAPSAVEYAGPLDLTRSTQVRARVWHSGAWSALTEAVFAVGPACENLQITEIMYHSPEPDGEFIEPADIGTETISLNPVRFVHVRAIARPFGLDDATRRRGGFLHTFSEAIDGLPDYGGASMASRSSFRCRRSHLVLRRIISRKGRPEWWPKKPVAATGRTASAIIVSIIRSTRP